MNTLGSIAAGILAVGAGALVPAAAQAQISGDAYAVRAQFQSGGSESTLGRIGLAFAGGMQKNTVTKVLNKFNDTFGIASGLTEIATLTFKSGHVVSKAEFSGIGIDNFSTDGKGTLNSLTATLQVYPPPAPINGIAPTPLLLVTATKIADEADASVVVPQPPTVRGSASFGSLTISGSLIGSTPVTLSGDVAANTAVFAGTGIRIVGNEQITEERVACAKGACTVKRDAIRVHALAVHLDGASINGQMVSGDIIIGGSRASLN